MSNITLFEKNNFQNNPETTTPNYVTTYSSAIDKLHPPPVNVD